MIQLFLFSEEVAMAGHVRIADLVESSFGKMEIVGIRRVGQVNMTVEVVEKEDVDR